MRMPTVRREVCTSSGRGREQAGGRDGGGCGVNRNGGGDVVVGYGCRGEVGSDSGLEALAGVGAERHAGRRASVG